MEDVSSPSSAAEQIAHWYEKKWDALLDQDRARAGSAADEPATVDAAVLARVHEQAWRHGVVHARRSTAPEDWADFDVDAEARTYWELLRSMAAKYGIRESDVVGVQAAQGYRHHPR